MNSVSELSEHQRRLLSHYAHPHMFAVVSWGCAATRWLAKVLDSHPDIFCVHAENFFWKALGHAPPLDGTEYLRLIGAQGHGYLAAGDVHGVSRQQIPALRAEFGTRFSSAVVIRDPIPRFKSQLALFERYAGLPEWNVDYVDKLIVRLDLPVDPSDYRAKLVVHAAECLNAIVVERSVGPVFRVEDLTTSHATLSRLVTQVTGGAVKPSEAWCARAVALRPINRHASSDSRSIAFAPWMNEVLRKVVNAETWEAYAAYGYDVDSPRSR